MHYLIDGYNVTRRDPATKNLLLEEQRLELESRLRIKSSVLLGKATYTIIWDASGGIGTVNPTGAAHRDSEYTRLPTADDAIVAKVRRATERIGIVTSDNELANRCRSAAPHGVDILPAERLFADAKPKKARDKKAPLPRDVGIPPNANEINRELKKIWGIED
ncbi:NYN domain-containing protein [Raoultibacter phocaeensis]|uniref:NYN domain-containing protein n=1 Tax=Raoultibacter phocaeensis TaxID=2479841 RepID=UPI0015D579AA|nr:NYN domain-containing protein [Raoultibacter phocaeensis]